MDIYGFISLMTSLFSIGQGVAANDAAQKEAAAQKDVAAAKLKEGGQAAKIETIKGDQFKSNQALAYLASGVTLTGSPLSVLEETQFKTQMETQSILDRAKNQYSLDITKAENLQSQGTAALFGGLTKAAPAVAGLRF